MRKANRKCSVVMTYFFLCFARLREPYGATLGTSKSFVQCIINHKKVRGQETSEAVKSLRVVNSWGFGLGLDLPMKQHLPKEEWDLRLNKLQQMISLPSKQKVTHSLNMIRKWIRKYGNIVLSFSGGKDSIVMKHLALQVKKNIKHLYIDTRNEHKSITPFVKECFKKVDGDIIYPEKNFIEIFKTEGIPVYSKLIAENVKRGQRGNSYGYLKKIAPKYVPLVNSGVKISDMCCYWLKKKPAEDYYKKNNCNVCMLGISANESKIRRKHWILYGCEHNLKTKDMTHLYPLAFWTDKDVWSYIRKNKLAYPEMYDKGYERSGCMFCGFGAHINKPNKFELLAKEDFNYYKSLMKKTGLYKKIMILNSLIKPQIKLPQLNTLKDY